MVKKAVAEFFKQYDNSIIIDSNYYYVTGHSVIYLPNDNYIIGYTVDIRKKIILELQKELDFVILDEFELNGMKAIKYKMKQLRLLNDMHKEYIQNYFLNPIKNVGAYMDYKKLEYVRPFTNSEFNKIIDLIYEVKPISLDLHMKQFLLDENNDIVLIDCDYSEELARKTQAIVEWYKEKNNKNKG